MHINLIAHILKIFGVKTKTKGLPESTWVFGCSPGAAADITADLDRGGKYPNIWQEGDYPIPPVGDHFGYWDDEKDEYPSHPLVASQMNVTGKTTGGTIEDYWVHYDSPSPDPYITGGWEQHGRGQAIGDYMYTSQSTYDNDDE